jgi:hypothetical protein
LVESLVSEYYYSMRQISLLLIEDFSQSNRVIHKAVKDIVKIRHKTNGTYRIKTLLFAAVFKESQRINKTPSFKYNFSSPQINQPEILHNQLVSLKTASGDVNLEGILTQLDYLYLYLQFVHGFTHDEIAFVTGNNSPVVEQGMVQFRIALIEKDPDHVQFLHKSHPSVREEILRRKCGCLSDEREVSLDLHLSECRACKVFSERVHQLENDLRQSVMEMWPQERLASEGTQQLLTVMDKETTNRRRKRFGVNTKELVIGTAALFFVVVMGWYGSNFYVVSSEPVSAEPTPINIYIQKITATPSTPGEKIDPAQPGPASPGRKRTDPIIALQNEKIRRLSIEWDKGILAGTAAFPPFKVSSSSALTAVLHYWGWYGSFEQIMEQLQPNPYHSQVAPSDLVDFVRGLDGLKAIVQDEGNFDIIQNGIDAGYPIIVFKGYGNFDRAGAADTYQVVYGYNQEGEQVDLLLEIGLEGASPVDYEMFAQDWMKSDYEYIVVYPEIEENRVRRVFKIQHDLGYYRHLLLMPVGYDHYYR